MAVFVKSGPAEILRSVQKDQVLFELVEKKLTAILIKICGTTTWLRYRQWIQVGSKFLYYVFTTLSGYQTLGEEYTNIVQVDITLRRTPSLTKRLLLAILDAGGFTFIDYSVNKLERRIHKNVFLHEEFKQKFLRLITIFKAIMPFLVHFHHAIFYWNGTYYDIVKRILGIRYILSKPWLSKDKKMYGFQILATVTMLHLLISLGHSMWKWYKSTPVYHSRETEIDNKSSGKCSLCLEARTFTCSTTCGHLYCWYCILHWLQTNNQCPICRDIIEPSRIVPLLNYG